jgi:hypothetical protein
MTNDEEGKVKIRTSRQMEIQEQRDREWKQATSKKREREFRL